MVAPTGAPAGLTLVIITAEVTVKVLAATPVAAGVATRQSPLQA
jgi:hypothetical protein